MTSAAARDPARSRKYRQAAIVYLHYAVLYWIGARVLLERGLFPETRGPEWVWLYVLGIGVPVAVVAALWWWQNRWFARVLWAVVALRLPTLMEGAFLPKPDQQIGPGFYLAAGLVVLVVMAALARAGWDL